MIQLRALLIAVLVPTVLWAQPSQPPNSPEPKPTEITQPKSEPDLRGTAQMPLAIEIVPTQADKEKERKEWLRDHAKEHEETQLVIETRHLVEATIWLAVFTALLFLATAITAIRAERMATKAVKASTAATETLTKIERAYVTAGGASTPTSGGYVITPRNFQLQAQNIGKTPAFMTDYDVRFVKLVDIRGTDKPALPVEKRYPFDDRLAANQFKDIDNLPVEPIDADVVYGAIWYRDWSRDAHCFRFILRLPLTEDTRPDISRLVHPDYSKWD